MGGHGSGARPLPVEALIARGTFRADRHADRLTPPPETRVSAADRRRTLSGLGPEARRLAVALLDEFSGWDAASLVTLRAYAMAAERVEKLQSDPAADARELRAELRAMVALHRGLKLEQPR